MILVEPIGFSHTVETFKTITKKLLRHADHRHTPDEKILDHRDFTALKKPFKACKWRGYQLFATRITRVIPLPDWLFYPLLRLDATIMRLLPFLRSFCRMAVIILQK